MDSKAMYVLLLVNALAERFLSNPSLLILLLFSVPPLFSSHDVEMMRIAMTTFFLIFMR
jgi:hypothetical protein